LRHGTADFAADRQSAGQPVRLFFICEHLRHLRFTPSPGSNDRFGTPQLECRRVINSLAQPQ
jgi:hypothetical protein